MEVKVINKGEKNWTRIPPKSNPPLLSNKCPLFKSSYSSPLFSDNSEFPSLTASSEKFEKHPCSSGTVKYSDKVRSSCSTSNTCDSDTYSKNNHVQVPSSPYTAKNFKTQRNSDQSMLNKKMPNNSSNLGVSSSQKYSIEEIPVVPKNCKTRKSGDQSKKSPSRALTSHGPSCKNLSKEVLENNLSADLSSSNFNNSSSAVYIRSGISKTNSSSSSCKATGLNSSNLKSAKANEENSEETKVKKKRKRKSKLKRQVAFQTGKLSILTPEVHSKILGISNKQTTASTSNKIITDINNQEEYPELGKSFHRLQKQETVKKEDSSSEFIEIHEKNMDAIVMSPIPKTISIDNSDENNFGDKKVKSSDKVHPKDPIIISFFDVVLSKPKIKAKITKDKEPEASATYPPVKPKKITAQPHNILDSSPATKRGKEREIPKVKKPSQLKKIILMDRQAKKEQMLLKKSTSEGNNFEGQENEELSDERNLKSMQDLGDPLNSLLENAEPLQPCNESSLTERECIENVSKLEKIKTSDDNKDGAESNEKEAKNSCNPEACQNETREISETFLEGSSESNSNQWTVSSALILQECNESLSERKKAAKLVLHTRHFREYCNHLISQDIDNAVHALLDDLARFQDRMHQKDPVKAKMKRRMIYGIKDVKKYIKLKKLKCIIIATDIENIETEGGLNDILNDIKLLAAEHNIPCIFSLSRRSMGKVCHKPVPVSCVGIFNYEGSEANFKKIIELQEQSKKDYIKMLNCLEEQLTDEESSSLMKMKEEAPENLHNFKADILRRLFFQKPQAEEEIENAFKYS